MKYCSLSCVFLQHALLADLGSVEDALRMVTPVQCSKVHVAGFNYLKGNPWVMPPESVVNKGVLAVNKYLLALRAAERAGAEVKALKLLKVVLIGSAHAGKTRCKKLRWISHFDKPAYPLQTINERTVG